MIDGIDLSRIQDEATRELIVRLMNLIEQLAAENRDLRAKNQELRDENNRLKGEQGKPEIKGKKAQARCAAKSLLGERAAKQADFKRFWEYYAQLLLYRQSPSPDESLRLEAEFDRLFATRTGYDELDQRIAKTQTKKANLLLVLKRPELPLHNNPAELGARQRVRKRDVSFGPRTQDGVRAWDTFATLAATTKKLGLSFYRYIFDRISDAGQFLPLALLVENAAKELDLGRSWAPG
jgi:hypothetical protein